MARKNPTVRRKRPVRQRPYPEAITGDRWSITEQENQGRCGIAERMMVVPLGDSALDQAVRVHEQAHVAWSPESPAEVAESWGVELIDVLAAEDARVNTRTHLDAPDAATALRGLQVGRSRLRARAEEAREAWDKDPAAGAEAIVNLARMALASTGTVDARRCDEEISRTLSDVSYAASRRHRRQSMAQAVLGAVKRARRHVGATASGSASARQGFRSRMPNSTGYAAMELAELAKRLGNVADSERQDRERQARHDELGDEQAQVMDGLEEMLREAGRMKTSRDLNDALESLKHDPPEIVSGDGVWGDMTIVHPPRPVSTTTGFGRTRRPARTGTVPRYMGRLRTSGAVFARKRRSRDGGVVLIDDSGSMGLTRDEVRDILHASPFATVACYSGSNERGVLTILAQDGRMVADDYAPVALGGNEIDGPALRWAARQPGPRIWVSDGGVTGRGDCSYEVLVDDAAGVCASASIARIDGSAEAVEYMERLGLHRRTR